MTDKVRIGIIGSGQIGKRHVAGYQEIPEAEIVAVADLREDEAQRVAELYNIPNVYTDYHELLARDDIDSVDVCLHNRLHKPVTLDAFEAGKHVFCEKPISWIYRDAKAMVEAAAAAGKRLYIQLNTLFEPETRAAKHLIDSGLLGDLYYAKSSHYRRRGRPFVDGYGTSAFVNTETSGGGALLDMAVYHIARMLYLLGNPRPLRVSGHTYQKVDNMYEDRRLSSGYNVEELGVGLVHLEGEITFFVEEAWAIHGENPASDTVYGSKGGLRVTPLSYYTTLADMEMDAAVDVPHAILRWERCDPSQVYYSDRQLHWIAALLGRIPLIDTAGLALNTAFITEGIYIANHLGREVTAEEIEEAEPGLGRV